MGITTNTTSARITVKELSEDECLNDIINKVAEHLQVSIEGGNSSGITICRGNITDTFVGDYCIRENGSGTTIGLFKRVNGKLEQIKFAIPGELSLVEGTGLGPVSIPSGWVLVEDASLQQRYNVGSSPNWEVALIKYIGA